jgi:hypothetical protein
VLIESDKGRRKLSANRFALAEDNRAKKKIGEAVRKVGFGLAELGTRTGQGSSTAYST